MMGKREFEMVSTACVRKDEAGGGHKRWRGIFGALSRLGVFSFGKNFFFFSLFPLSLELETR